jgi:4-amino-4-deoxy-L-arabinose transferase-like glycosyltransferase
VGALFLRGLWAAIAVVDPTDGRFDDSVFYHNVAASLARGDGYTGPWTGFPTAQWPPGYPFFLAGIYSLFGPTVAGARLANVVLGAATAALVYVLALRLFDKRTAILAGLLAAVFPGQIFFVSLVWSEVVFTFAFVLALLLVVMVVQVPGRQRQWWLVAAGLLFGVAALTRGQGLLLPIVAFVTWGVFGRDWARALAWTGVTLACIVAVILPWTIRNYLVLGGPIFITTSFGGNFYVGHTENGWADLGVLIEKQGPLTRPRGEVDIGNAALREGLQFLVTHPREEIRLTLEKVRDLYRDDYSGVYLLEGSQGHGIENPRLKSLLKDLANSFYFLVIGASAVPLMRWRRDKAALFFPLLVIGLWTLGSVVFFTVPRFHFPVMPVFCLLAGRAAVSPRRALLLAVPAALGAVLIPQLA